MLKNIVIHMEEFCFYSSFVFSILMVAPSAEQRISDNKECEIGMTGTNCKIPCRFPSFGKGCQHMCHCPEVYCNTTVGCTVCRAGYIGNNCSLPCRFPAYGVSCQSACHCSKEQCNHVTGCKGATLQTSTFIEDSKSTSKENPGNDYTSYALKIVIVILAVFVFVLFVSYKCAAPLQNKYFLVKSNQASCEELIITND